MKKRGTSVKRSTQWTEKMKAEAADMWNGGMSAARIAVHFRVTRNAVIGIINRNRQQFPRGNKVYEPKPARPPRAAKPKPVMAASATDAAAQKPNLAKPSALGAAVGLTPRSTAAPKTDFPVPEFFAGCAGGALHRPDREAMPLASQRFRRARRA